MKNENWKKNLNYSFIIIEFIFVFYGIIFIVYLKKGFTNFWIHYC